jgi:hypothetical protein
MSKRFTITEDEKRQIKGLYLINEDDVACQNETFKITQGTKVIKTVNREQLTNEVKKTKGYLDVDRYCNGKIEHSYQASYENGKLSLDQVGA